MNKSLIKKIDKIIRGLEYYYNNEVVNFESSKKVNINVEDMLNRANISIRYTDDIFLKYGSHGINCIITYHVRKSPIRDKYVFVPRSKLSKYMDNYFDFRNIMILETLKEIIK